MRISGSSTPRRQIRFDLVQFAHRQAKRFLNKDVFSGSDPLADQASVSVVLGRDENRIDLLVREDGIAIGRRFFKAELPSRMRPRHPRPGHDRLQPTVHPFQGRQQHPGREPARSDKGHHWRPCGDASWLCDLHRLRKLPSTSTSVH